MSREEPHAEGEPRPQDECPEQAVPQTDDLDPNGPPVPVAQGQQGCSLTTTVLSLLAVGVGGALLILPATRPTMGATRSTQLQWEQRQAEIERAFAEEQAYRQDAGDE